MLESLLNFRQINNSSEVKAFSSAADLKQFDEKRIRVVRVAHASLTPALRGRERAVARCFPEIDMEVVTPPRWREAEVEVEPSRTNISPCEPRRRFYPKHIQLFAYDPRPIIEVLKRHKPHIIDMNHEPYSVPCAEILTLRNLFAPQARIVMQTAQNILKIILCRFQQWKSARLNKSLRHICAVKRFGKFWRQKVFINQ
jgi:hypothetical protein